MTKFEFKNTLQYIKKVIQRSAKSAKIFGVHKKSSHWVSAVRDRNEEVEGSIGSESSDCGERLLDKGQLISE